MRKKGPTMVKMNGINPQKNFCSASIKKVPRAYDSLNPALYMRSLKDGPKGKSDDIAGTENITYILKYETFFFFTFSKSFLRSARLSTELKPSPFS